MESALFIWGGRSIPELVEPGPRDRLLASGNDLINVLVSDLRELLLPLNSVILFLGVHMTHTSTPTHLVHPSCLSCCLQYAHLIPGLRVLGPAYPHLVV